MPPTRRAAARRPTWPGLAAARWLGLAARVAPALALLLAASSTAAIDRPVAPSPAATAAIPPGPHPDRIRVTLDDNYPPYSFRDGTGAHVGIVKDLWALWSEKTGIPVQLMPTDWSLAREAMDSGAADVIETIFRNAARDRTYDFSKPYARVDVPIWFSSDLSGITGVDSLHAFTVGVKDGDFCLEWLSDHGITAFQRYGGFEAMVEAAARRETRVFCMDDPSASYYMTRRGVQGRFRYTEPLYTGELHWAVHKGDTALFRLITDGFARITPQERQAVDDRWLGRRITGTVSPELMDLMVKLLGGMLLLGIGAMVWVALLRRQVEHKTESLRTAVAALTASEERVRTIFDGVTDAIFIHDLDSGAILEANRRMREMYRLGDTPLKAVTIADLSAGVAPYTSEDAATWIRKAAAGEPQLFEWHARTLDGTLFWVEVSMRRATLDGTDRRLLVVARDITERRTAQERMEFLSRHDALTLLPNRLLVQDRTEQALARSERSGRLVALVACGLDRFKTVNDSLGHAVGDALLRAVAERLKATMHETDTVSRGGGDEFILLLSSLPDADAVVETVASLHEAMAEPFLVEGRELTVTLSSGVAMAPADGRDFATLLQNADTALHHAKAAGRDTHRFYAEAMNAEAVVHLSTRSGLRRALERNEFLVHYQPQVNLESGAVTGAEALIRWNHPERGMVPPGSFIPIAEDSGLIVPIGNWVLAEACRQAAQWRAAGLSLSVAVNLSALQLQRSDLVRTVTQALADSGLDPLLLELELTESMLIQNTDQVIDNLRRIKAMGVQVSIDDFGTGYSNLSYIGRLAVDKLKIDRSFIADLTSNHDSARITAAVIQMAHSLNLTAVAEGVEDAGTLEALRQLRCDVAQGYFLGRPGPAEAVERAARTAIPFTVGA
ncbi:diguanylate cyclase (GGDEF)-like protein/PAS domain S-box-containing protein [Azospirillum picis]|uniref:Diguanylate cyclase (GGDEF)-like protein/PAS domain S-box-containing protein n=1 Tax=Azospirillum picis TaxID=488438 RepID=A0ABU0MP75_9PROT|nr:EAL domain-containing protein [Azospirillum picis]MBP2301439.1 diguanylate cyclase (GGDEF)-like protein/PAS domain S-box-containing protein [Azospirillum picis]MDQ0535271.1 diguanylate cyclase (GGDEF)-like protein/PAS domain S-box-containing protein [Azospirillum picis]